MAKMVGYEVTGVKPVCVDFPDGRAVSFRPGMRFTAHPTNASVRRLERVRQVRRLGAYEKVPELPVKLGAPKEVRSVLETRKKMAAARRLAETKRTAERKVAKTPDKMEPIDLSALNKPRRKKGSEPSEDRLADN
ncbi:MAG: hypothetical protein R3268_01560 [Acidiferrobacterales bacterium]|nr:hypothetical protein [Acidiferrobacterales bacterium]